MRCWQFVERLASERDRVRRAADAGSHRAQRRYFAPQQRRLLGAQGRNACFSPAEVCRGGIIIGAECLHTGLNQRESRTYRLAVTRQLRQPAGNGRALAVEGHVHTSMLDRHPGGKRVLNCLSQQVFALKPATGPLVQCRQLGGGHAAAQPLAEHIGE